MPPEIHWTQNSFNVMLSVKVKGVSNSPDLVKVEDDMVTFRLVVSSIRLKRKGYNFRGDNLDKIMFASLLKS